MQQNSQAPLQFKGSPLAQRLLRWAGWQIHFDGLPSLQGVLIGYPHTSNWDFILMVMVKWAIGLQVQFLAKDSLFRFPIFSSWLRRIGGVATDRAAPHGLVEQMVALIQTHRAQERFFWLGMAPEGTRRLTSGWKSGFYRVALQAKVPICMARIDWGHKTVDLRQTMMPTGDMAQDYASMAQAFDGVVGFHPQQASPICPLAVDQIHH